MGTKEPGREVRWDLRLGPSSSASQGLAVVARKLVAIPIADILSAGVMGSDDDEDVLEVRTDVLGGER